MSGYKHVKYSLAKLAKVKIVKLINAQVWDVNITIRFRYEWDIEGVTKRGPSQLMTLKEAIKAPKIAWPALNAAAETTSRLLNGNRHVS